MTQSQRQDRFIQRLRNRILGYHPFMVGDIVKVKPGIIHFLVNESEPLATIKAILNPSVVPNYHLYSIGLEFNHEHRHFHDLGGQSKPGHGWWLPADAIELVRRMEDIEDE